MPADIMSPKLFAENVAAGEIVENPDAPGTGWWTCPEAHAERARRLARRFPLDRYALPALACRLARDTP